MPSTPSSAMDYRADIDGLRAVAVLSVMLFHVNRHLLPGGFIGVDIFLVISGYLISRNIASEIAQGHFSLVEFYRRRIRRISPMMLVVTVATLLGAWALMTPDDARSVAKSAVWSVASLANVFFWRELDTGYFANNSAEVPLLHYWSLGVEEQFYMLWPAMLVVAFRWLSARTVLLGGAGLALVSFAYASRKFDADPSFAYYMLPTRAGELLVGGVLGILSARGMLDARLARFSAASAWLGTALLAGSMALLNEQMRFPGWLALPATLGAAMLILAGEQGQRNPAGYLSWRPMVQVGKLSYSAYLWHWPLLALYRYGFGEPGAVAGLALFMATFALAWVSFQYVERPTRRSTRPFLSVALRQFVVPGGGAVLLALLVVYGQQLGVRLYPASYVEQLATVQQRIRPPFTYEWICQRQRLSAKDLVDPRCEIGASTSQPATVLVWGDSNAAHYVPMLGVIGEKAGLRMRNIEVGACPPLLVDPAPYVEPRRVADCRASSELMKQMLPDYRTVIIAASWLGYSSRNPDFLDRTGDLVRDLAAGGHQVLLIGRAPLFPGFDRRCREKALRYPSLSCSDFSQPLQAEVTEVNMKLRAMALSISGVRYFDANQYLCPNDQCRLLGDDGWPKYFDPGHLSVQGSIDLGRQILSRDGMPEVFHGLKP